MKVLYIINNNSTGTGGHLNSLKNTIDALKPDVTPLTVVIGKRPSPLFNPKYFLRFEKVSDIFNCFHKIGQVIKEFKPGVIHTFDLRSLFFGRILSRYFSIPLIGTKCGGKTIKHPFVRQFILFSFEDYYTYKDQKKFEKAQLYFIPNRVSDFQSDKVCVDIIKKDTEGKKVLLRISRISNYYKASFYQVINLVKRLNKDRIKTVLVIIGYIQSQELYDELKNTLRQEELLFYTSPKFTVNARKSIAVADMVLGTGRGFMEATFKNKILLTPLKDIKYPALVTQDNIKKLFYTNFSERNEIENFDEKENYKQIKTFLTNPEQKQHYLERMAALREQYFNIDKIKKDYLDIYEDAIIETKIHILDFLFHLKTIMKFLLITK